ncbi:hypothetical protein HanRHA438_Chr16g0782001 [Helianthus annuus]|nr:hypothetical protein HanRHA438_Chr16g0782001 [Helianthus annuus]
MIKRSCWTEDDDMSEHTLSDRSSSMSEIMPATVIIRGICRVIRVNEDDGNSPEARSNRFEYDLDTILTTNLRNPD